jgi:hypothetical protein
MQVAFDEGELFYGLYAALLSFVNRKLNVSSETFSDSRKYTSTPPEARVAVRDALFAHRELIDEFVRENPANLSVDQLEIVALWKHAVVGKFYVFRYLKKHTIFLSADEPAYKAYGVLGLADPIEEVINRPLPVLCNAVLLPFRGQIIYDGLIASYSVFFGGGVRRNLTEDYNRAKETFGIITSLPEGNRPPASAKRPKKQRVSAPGRSSGAEAKAVLGIIVEMTDSFCKEYLNDEYAELCRKLAEKLARKRPSPLLQGRPETWASGIVRTIGWVNFLHDPSQTPHMKLSSIDQAFGISESTGAAKLKTIRTMLRIRQFDPKWTVPSLMENNPMVWMLEVNGLLMDVRYAPREIQVAAYEKGLIPYIPADREDAGEES